MKKEKVLIKLILVIFISSTLLGCSKEAAIKTAVEINPLDKTEITEMILERADKTFTVSEQEVIEEVIEKLTKIKVKKLSPEQEESFLDNKQRHAAGYTYNLILRDEAHEIKTYAVLLFNRDNKALMLVDLKTKKSNSEPDSYANIDNQETLDYVNDIYSIAAAEASKDFLNKVKEKGINEIMLSTLGNLGYGEEEILNISPDDLARIFAPGTHLDGGGFDPNEQQKAELAKIGIDTSMSVILANLGYEYEEMLELSPEEIDFIFPNTELIANLVARGFNEQDVQTWVVLRSGKTYKEIIEEALTNAIEVKPDSDTRNADTFNNNEQKQEPSEVQFTFYPSGVDFIKNIIHERGSVKITAEMRELFNLFARDYRFVYLPDMNYYESFFEANEYAKSFGYTNFGFAVFYVLQYMRCPEKMSDEAMQNAVQNLFVDKNLDVYRMNYKDMPHCPYPKLANYENGYYSPCSEGGLDHDRMFYLLTGLDIVQEGYSDLYITVRTKSYYFNDPSYKPGENEKWLAEKSKEMGIPDMQAAVKLIANGEMKELKGDHEFETTIHIKYRGNNPFGYDPRFVSSRSRCQP